MREYGVTIHNIAHFKWKNWMFSDNIVLCKKIRNHNFVDSLDASIGI